jgi:hypothetical protein
MLRQRGIVAQALLVIILAALASTQTYAQKKQKHKKDSGAKGTPVMWHQVDIADQNLLLGPGGDSMKPDLSNITFLEREKGGSNTKYRIKDAAGHVWVVKYGREAKPETAAVRLLWGLGYATEINYWVPQLTIPSVGTLNNVRLEARPESIKREDNWDWKNNPFVGTNELQGLKIMMVLFNNWDIRTSQNKVIEDKATGQQYYIISDLGASFGKLGSNSLPIFWRLGRSIGKPNGYAKTSLVRGVKNGQLKLSFKGKHASIFEGVTVAQGRWLADQLLLLRDDQIRDAFRAADYSPADVNTLTAAVKKRISELDDATKNERLASDVPSQTKTRSRYAKTKKH